MTEPTDTELDAVLCKHWPAFSMQATLVRMWVRAAMRDAITKWDTPPAEQQATKETSGGFHVWRDISTAPKDGSRFVAIGYNYGLYSEGRHICVAQWFRGCWMETSDWNEASELKHLTHWLPLPSPPDNAAELNDLDVSVSPQQAAPKAAPGKQFDADGFRAWVLQNLPDETIIGSSAWWADHLTTWAQRFVKAAPQQEAQEPIALLVRKNSWRAGQWEAAPPDSPHYGLTWANQRKYVYEAPQPAPAPLSDDVVQKTWALLDELEKLRSVNREEEDWDTLNKRDSELRAALAAQGGE